MIRRSGTVAEDTRDTDTELRAALDAAHARIDELTDQLDLANGRADREARGKQQAKETLEGIAAELQALRETAAEVTALRAEMRKHAPMPRFAAIHTAPFDEPMPEDARVTKAGKVMGTWPPVAGDLGEHYGTVEPVDFRPLYELIGATELAEVA